MMIKISRLFSPLILISLHGFSISGYAQSSGESRPVCEVKPILKCLDKAEIEGDTLQVTLDDMAIAQKGFSICDSSFNYTTSPDVVLIMDNTTSMRNNTVVNGIPRWRVPINGDESISGDPDSLRGPALKSFLDSALIKGGKDMKVGVVTFSIDAKQATENLVPLNSSTIAGIKASIIMNPDGETNYTAAFRAAMNLFQSSTKPKSEQFIIFISDGRPNFPKRPDGDPHEYISFWDSIPTVNSIFLGDNAADYKDMQDISSHTGGLFFHLSDVNLLAKILTDDLAKKLFRRATPTKTTIQNLTTKNFFQVDSAHHELGIDSTVYQLTMPGPLYLKKGVNEIVLKTFYGQGITSQDVRFKINRSAENKVDSTFAFTEACRDKPKLILYDWQNQAINFLGLPYTIRDSLLRYSLTTSASSLDSFDIVLRTQSPGSAQSDLETVFNSSVNRKDSTWSGQEIFEHQSPTKNLGDHFLQINQGDFVLVSYNNPYIPEDSVIAMVKVKYGPDLNRAAFFDLDGDGKIETADILFLDPLAAIPDSLKFHLADVEGKGFDRIAIAKNNEIKFASAGISGTGENQNDLKHILVSLNTPFPYGITRVVFPDTAGRTFKQLDIPMASNAFRIDDSVPPVILSADFLPVDNDHANARVKVHYSEIVAIDANPIQAIVFKRDTVVFSRNQIPIKSFEKTGEKEYVFTLESGSEFTPVGGDSVAINPNGETKDLFGRAPIMKVFTPMGGPVPNQSVSDFYVTFANGSRSEATGASEYQASNSGAIPIMIPVDSKGSPMPGMDHGKCETCNPKQGDKFSGSVIVIVTRYPVNYQFTIFSNLGELVAKFNGSIEEKDLSLLSKTEDPSHDPNLTEYTQRIVWTGATNSGQKAGTGAYILRSVFKYDQSFKTGARPSLSTKFTRFGFIR